MGLRLTVDHAPTATGCVMSDTIKMPLEAKTRQLEEIERLRAELAAAEKLVEAARKVKNAMTYHDRAAAADALVREIDNADVQREKGEFDDGDNMAEILMDRIIAAEKVVEAARALKKEAHRFCQCNIDPATGDVLEYCGVCHVVSTLRDYDAANGGSDE